MVAHEIAFARPVPFSGLKIAVIADLHGGPPHINAAKIARLVAMTNAAKPDLVLLAGDYAGHLIGFPTTPVEDSIAPLASLSAPLGVYAVLGNHDHIVEGAGRVKAALAAAHITVLGNSHVVIHGPHSSFLLAGIDDAQSGHADATRALDGVGPSEAALCLTHSPDIFPKLPASCVLTIAAHTHGGQVSLPLLGPLFVPSHYGRRYAAGLKRENGKTMFVSTGIGTSILPIRLGVPPEISLLTIQ